MVAQPLNEPRNRDEIVTAPSGVRRHDEVDLAVTGILRKITAQQTESLLETQDLEFLSSLMDHEYVEACADLQESGLYNFDSPPKEKRAPNPEEAKAILLRKLTPTQMEIVKNMKNPVFQLKPKKRKDDYIAALNTIKTIPKQTNAYISDRMNTMWDNRDLRDGLSRRRTSKFLPCLLSRISKENEVTSLDQNQITGWQIEITEGADVPNLLPGDDIKKTLGQRFEWFAEEYGSKGVQGTDFRSSSLLQIRALRQKPPQPLDDLCEKDKTWTILNGEGIDMDPIFEVSVPCSYWYKNCVNFREEPASDKNKNARFRVSVVIDVD